MLIIASIGSGFSPATKMAEQKGALAKKDFIFAKASIVFNYINGLKPIPIDVSYNAMAQGF